MSVIVSAARLASAVSSCKSIISSKATIPVLQCAMIKAENGILSIEATDMTRGISIQMPCEGSGKWLVSFERLQAFTSATIKSKDVTISGDVQAQFKCGSATARISTLPIADFPSMMNAPEFSTKPTFENSRFVSILSGVSAACERSGQILGRSVRAVIDGTQGVASTCESAVVCKVKFDSDAPCHIDRLIDIDDCAVLASVFAKSPIWIAETNGVIWCKSTDIVFHTKSVDAQQPDISSVEPSSHEFTSFDVASLSSALKAVSAMSDQRSRALYIYRKNGTAFVGAVGSEASMCVPFDCEGESELGVMVNADKLQSVLTACPTETALIGASNGSGIITPRHIQVQSGGFLALVMSMRCTQDEINRIVNSDETPNQERIAA
jgi:DNA polymerase III sliding clamp (beta) subunit (PCNA family)